MAEYSSYQELIDRDDANDLDAILGVDNPYVDAAITTVADGADAIFTWDYEKGARPALNKLYEKAKNSQWNGETDLDWSIDVDPEAIAVLRQRRRAQLGGHGLRPHRHPARQVDRQGVDPVGHRAAELEPQPVHAR